MAINTLQTDGGGGGGTGGGSGSGGNPQVTPGEEVTYGSKIYNPRLSEPPRSDKNWIKSTKGGYSLCIIPNPCKNQSFSPYTVPNCVSYAWGRARELCLQWNCSWPNERFGNPPQMWYSSYWQKKWARGYVPRLGALTIWYNKKGKYSNNKPQQGHIAVVEQLHYASNGKLDYFVVSQSGYPTPSNGWGNPPKYRRWELRKIYANQNFKYTNNYPFMGFYYPPYVGFFSTDAGPALADGNFNANGYCGTSVITIYHKNPETGEWEPVQGTGNYSYDPNHPGIPEDTPVVPPKPEPAYPAGSEVKVKGQGNTNKMGTGKPVDCIGATYKVKSIHSNFPYAYRIGTDTHGIGYFKETDLEKI